jgi:vancomycin resistance protein YoaR
MLKEVCAHEVWLVWAQRVLRKCRKGNHREREHCFDVHMSTSANQNTKKHLEEVKEFEKSGYAFFYLFVKNCRPHNIRHVQTSHKA